MSAHVFRGPAGLTMWPRWLKADLLLIGDAACHHSAQEIKEPDELRLLRRRNGKVPQGGNPRQFEGWVNLALPPIRSPSTFSGIRGGKRRVSSSRLRNKGSGLPKSTQSHLSPNVESTTCGR
jgi:hypothetical protein